MPSLKNTFCFAFSFPLILIFSSPVLPEGMDHSGHKAMIKQKNSFTKSQPHYMIPDVVLLQQDGETINLREFLGNSEPYALNFIFTTCTTICPILTSSFAHMQRELGSEADNLRLISITIDPEYDTPAVLQAYATKVGATKNWTFLTGDFETIQVVEHAFNAYTANKMEHKPTYLFKMSNDNNWVRIDGLANGSELAAAYKTGAQF